MIKISWLLASFLAQALVGLTCLMVGLFIGAICCWGRSGPDIVWKMYLVIFVSSCICLGSGMMVLSRQPSGVSYKVAFLYGFLITLCFLLLWSHGEWQLLGQAAPSLISWALVWPLIGGGWCMLVCRWLRSHTPSFKVEPSTEKDNKTRWRDNPIIKGASTIGEKPSMVWVLLTGIVFIFFGTVPTALVWADYLHTQRVISGDGRAIAQIFEKRELLESSFLSRYTDRKKFYMSYRFNTKSNVVINKINEPIGEQKWNHLNIGNNIEIAYDVKNPSYNFPLDKNNKLAPISWLLLGAFLNTCGFWSIKIFLGHLKRKAKPVNKFV